MLHSAASVKKRINAATGVRPTTVKLPKPNRTRVKQTRALTYEESTPMPQTGKITQSDDKFHTVKFHKDSADIASQDKVQSIETSFYKIEELRSEAKSPIPERLETEP